MIKKLFLAATIILSTSCMYYDGEDNSMCDDGEDNGLQLKDHTFDPSCMGCAYDVEVLPPRPQELNSARALPNSMDDCGAPQVTTQQDILMQSSPQEDLEIGDRRMTLSLSGWPMPQDGEDSPV